MGISPWVKAFLCLWLSGAIWESLGMEIRLSADGAYYHEYHVVWIPKHRKRILKGEVKAFVEKHIFNIQGCHPEIEIERCRVQTDHAHLMIIIPPEYSVSRIIGKIKAHTSRELRHPIDEVRKIYRGNEFWSPGFFSSTVGISEETIKSYVEFQDDLLPIEWAKLVTKYAENPLGARGS
jgi:putative transposase